jgi:hypothetical protein
MIIEQESTLVSDVYSVFFCVMNSAVTKKPQTLTWDDLVKCILYYLVSDVYSVFFCVMNSAVTKKPQTLTWDDLVKCISNDLTGLNSFSQSK